MTDELRPVCFIAMPFRRKKTRADRNGAPGEVDFDALWDRVYRPAIDRAGFTPVRADLDTGSVIVKDMIERLAYADLVLADVSLPNGNVYYEVGLRHAAREVGCILFAASWSRQLFDIDQFTSVRYDLSDGDVPEGEEAATMRDKVVDAIETLKVSKTPWYEYVKAAQPEWPDGGQGVFREEARKLSAFQADFRAIRLEDDKEKCKALVRSKVDALDGAAALRIPQAAVEMLCHVRDYLGWQEVLDFIASLDPSIQAIPFIEEQRLLALAKTGAPAEAITHMEALMDRFGETPERLGIIGGRYKDLWREAVAKRKAAGETEPGGAEGRHLAQAITHYEKGMALDFNEYYCSCNIATLLMARGKEGDLDRAKIVDHFVIAACERAIERGEDDGWTRQTLLGAAFRAQDVPKVRELIEWIREEGAVGWNLESTLGDIDTILKMIEESEEHEDLCALRDEIAKS